jgi:hypothetical protein
MYCLSINYTPGGCLPSLARLFRVASSSSPVWKFEKCGVAVIQLPTKSSVVARVGDYLYILHNNQVDRFDTLTQTYRQNEATLTLHLSTARTASTVVGTSIFMLADFGRMIEYQTDRKLIIEHEGPSRDRDGATLAAIGRNIYVFGGNYFDYIGVVVDFDRYRIDTKEWTSMKPLPSARGNSCAVVLNNDEIWIIGDGVRILSYRVSTNTWKVMPFSGPPFRASFVGAVYDSSSGRLFVATSDYTSIITKVYSCFPSTMTRTEQWQEVVMPLDDMIQPSLLSRQPYFYRLTDLIMNYS